jgi:septal ring factor EnvC (AmiA/AmiB activator)
MGGKVCDECGERFEPSRGLQRFCTTRCANRHRDRRRRQLTHATTIPSTGVERVKFATGEPGNVRQPVARQHTATRPFASTTQGRFDALQIALRSQSSELERVEAENAEQQDRITQLQRELAQLKRTQQTNIQDLAHVAAKLVAFSQAKGLVLDRATIAILRRRGWVTSRPRQSTPQP